MKEEKRKEAQGRRSRQIGNLNRTRILTILQQQPLTFKELQKQSELSQPILAKHLKKLKNEGLIEKTIMNDKIVYKIVSNEEIEKQIKSDLMDIILYILPFKPLNDFIASLVSNAIEYRRRFPKIWKEKLYEDKIFKPWEYQQVKARIEEAKQKEESLVYCFTKEKLERLRTKYPEAIEELLGESYEE